MEKLNLNMTGNPFIDTGIYPIKTMSNKETTEITLNDLKMAIDIISELYTQPGWKKDLYSIFPNSLLVNPSTTNNPHLKKKYLTYLNHLIDSIEPAQNNGSCMGCGKRNAKKVYGKDAIPLTGSKSLRNYFPFAKDGADYCPLCVLLIQFSPLFMYKCGGKFILLHSNSDKVMKIWAKNTINNIHDQITFKHYTGCYHKNIPPINAVFDIVFQIINQTENWIENPSLNFYEFSNYNQNPQLTIHVFPTKLFNYLTRITKSEQNYWKTISEKEYLAIKENFENNTFIDKKNSRKY